MLRAGDTPGAASGRCAPSTSLRSGWEVFWPGAKDPREQKMTWVWKRTVSPLLPCGVGSRWRRRRCAPGTGCVKAVQLHRGDLSSGSGGELGRRHVTRERAAEIHSPARFMMIDSTEESAVIQNGHVRSARPPCPTQTVSKDEQTAEMSSFIGLYNTSR